LIAYNDSLENKMTRNIVVFISCKSYHQSLFFTNHFSYGLF